MGPRSSASRASIAASSSGSKPWAGAPAVADDRDESAAHRDLAALVRPGPDLARGDHVAVGLEHLEMDAQIGRHRREALQVGDELVRSLVLPQREAEAVEDGGEVVAEELANPLPVARVRAASELRHRPLGGRGGALDEQLVEAREHRVAIVRVEGLEAHAPCRPVTTHDEAAADRAAAHRRASPSTSGGPR